MTTPARHALAARAWIGVGMGAIIGLPWLAAMDFGRRLADLPFAPFDLFSLLTHTLPGDLVTLGLEIMVGALQALRLGPTDRLGKALEVGMALGLTWLLLAALGATHAALGRDLRLRPGARAGLPGFLLSLLLLPLGWWAGWSPWEVLWILALCLAWGAATHTLVDRAIAVQLAPADPSRRAALARFGAGALVLSLLSLGLGRLLRRGAPGSAPTTEGAEPQPIGPGEFVPVAGTRPELTPVSEFYRVDIKLAPPVLDHDAWRLEIGGEVEAPLTLAYADLLNLPREDFIATLECISNRVGGDLIGTARFAGVGLGQLLRRAGVRPGVVDVKFVCADGYAESLPLASALLPETRLCYLMDGAPLTPAHGFPVRLFTPDRFGMKNPKWLLKIEALSDEYDGFWEKRRWSKAAWVKTTSVIDTARPAGQGVLEVGGIAYAGARGILKVEVRVEGGAWQAAETKPALSNLAWVLWRARVDAPAGRQRLTVRATDGSGALQIEAASDTFPDGATGHHHLTVQVD